MSHMLLEISTLMISGLSVIVLYKILNVHKSQKKIDKKSASFNEQDYFLQLKKSINEYRLDGNGFIDKITENYLSSPQENFDMYAKQYLELFQRLAYRYEDGALSIDRIYFEIGNELLEISKYKIIQRYQKNINNHVHAYKELSQLIQDIEIMKKK